MSVKEPPPPSGYEEFRANLEAARRGDAAVDYAAAYAEKPGQDAVRLNLEPLMRNGRPEATSHALDLVREEQRTITASLARARLAPNVSNAHIASLDEALTGMKEAEKQLAAIANGQPVREIGAQAVDYYQRGLRALEEAVRPGTEAHRSATTYRKAFNELSDQLYPGLGKARSSYAAKIDLREKVDAGRKFFTLPETEQNDLLRSATSPEQHDAIMVGVLEAVEDAIAKGDARAVLAMARKPAFLDALRKTARNEKAGERLVNLIRRKANQQFNANEIQGGSSTAPTQEAIRDLTTDGGEVGMVMDFIQSGGDPKVLGMKWLGQVWDNIQRPGIRSPEVSREYARILTQRLTAPQMKLFAQRIAEAQHTPVLKPGALRTARRAGVLGATTASRAWNGP